MEDIRLSKEVENAQEANIEYVQEKSHKLATEIKDNLAKHFDGKYDEMFGFVLYTRKGNDVNTIAVSTMMGASLSTGADRAMFRDSLHSLADAIDTNTIDEQTEE